MLTWPANSKWQHSYKIWWEGQVWCFNWKKSKISIIMLPLLEYGCFTVPQMVCGTFGTVVQSFFNVPHFCGTLIV